MAKKKSACQQDKGTILIQVILTSLVGLFFALAAIKTGEGIGYLDRAYLQPGPAGQTGLAKVKLPKNDSVRVLAQTAEGETGANADADYLTLSPAELDQLLESKVAKKTEKALEGFWAECEGCINDKQLGDNSVGNDELEKSAVSRSKIKSDAVTTSRIKDRSIESQDLAGELTIRHLAVEKELAVDEWMKIGSSLPSHFTLGDGDMYVTDNLEVDGAVWFDGTLTVRDASALQTATATTLTSTTLATTTANISNILSNSNLEVKGRLPNEDTFTVTDFTDVFIYPSGLTSVGADNPAPTHLSGESDQAHSLYVANNLEVAGIIYGTISGAYSPNGNLDMDNHLISDIGAAGTDFTASGGLNLAGALNIGAGSFQVSAAGIISAGTWQGSLISSAYLASNVLAEGENISLLTNNAGYITDGNTNWDNTYGFITDGNTDWDNTYGFITDGNTNWDNTYGFITAADTLSGLVRSTAAGNSYITGGNVGIGTTSPGSKFTVLGGDVMVREDDDGANAAALLADNSGGYLRLYGGGSMKVQLNGNTNADSYFNTGGNVGIGTTTPEYKLHVYQPINSAALVIDAPNVTTSSVFGVTGPLSVNLDSGKAFSVGVSGDVYGRAMFYTDGKFGIGSGSNTRDIFLSRSSANTFRISSDGANGTGNLMINGNVGIGTTSPGKTLDVVGEMRINSSGNGILYLGSGGSWIGRSSSLYQLVSDSSPIIFKSNGVNEDMRITSGNVGIGTTSPGSRLHVSDGNAVSGSIISGFMGNAVFSGMGPGGSNTGLQVVQASDTATGYRPLIGSVRSRGTLASPTAVQNGDELFSFLGAAYDGSSLQYPAMIDFNVDGTVSSGVVPASIDFITGNNSATRTSRLHISSNGNVGIGTTSPNYKLDVNGASNFTGIANFGGSYVAAVKFLSNNFGPNGDNDFTFVNFNSTPLVTIQKTGNVGIGTTSPQSLLDVYATTASDATRISVNTPSSVTNWIGYQFLSGTTFKGGLLRQPSTDNLALWTAADTSNPRVMILNSGNVGIGTTAPSSKLNIEGNNTSLLLVKDIQSNGSTFSIGAWGQTQWKYNDLSVARLYWHDNSDGYFELYKDAGTLTTRIDADGVSYLNAGNVGIGTTAPGALLEISKSTAPSLRISNLKDSGTFAQNEVLNTLEFYTGDTTSARVAASIAHISDYAGAHDTVRGALQFNISTTGAVSEAMRITSSGNVGIGTTSPGAKLELASLSGANGLLIKKDTDEYGGLEFDSTGMNTLTLYSGYNSDSSKINFATKRSGTAVTAMTILGSGNVGIGTTDPGIFKLNVNGNTNIGGSIALNGYSTLGNTGTLSSLYSGSSRFRVLNNGGASELMVVQNDGNVGIGTTGPSTKLHVVSGSDGNTATIADTDGTCVLDPESGGAWSCSSDVRLKKDISPLSGSLDLILNLNPVSFRMKVNDSLNHGFLAQELQRVYPQAVSTLPDGYLGVAEGKLIPHIVGAIQDQQQEIDIQKSINTAQDALLSQLSRFDLSSEDKFTLIGATLENLEDKNKASQEQLNDHQDQLEDQADQLEKLTADIKNTNQIASQLTVQLADHEHRIKTLEDQVKVLGASDTAEEFELPKTLQTLQENLEIMQKTDNLEFKLNGDLKAKTIRADELKTKQIKLQENETPPQCDTESEGTFYYNKQEKLFYGCDGDKWQKLQFIPETDETQLPLETKETTN